MKHCLKGLLAAGLLLFGSALASAQTVKVGLDPEPYPPFSQKDASGKWSGFEVELLDAFCAQMKVKCERVEIAWDGIIPALQSKKIDAIFNSMSITEERLKSIDFSNPYYRTPRAVAAGKGEDIDGSAAKMKGKFVGAQTGTIHADYVQKTYGDVATIKLYEREEQANADLSAGRVDAIVADSLALESFLATPEGANFEIKTIIPEGDKDLSAVGVGLRKGDEDLKGKFNAAIKATIDDGEYATIEKKYFKHSVMPH